MHLVGVSYGTATVEEGIVSLKKIKIELLYDPRIQFLSIYPKELKTVSQDIYIYTHIHSSSSMRATHMSIQR